MKTQQILKILIIAFVLTTFYGCGGEEGGGSSASASDQSIISGRVADGYIVGAKVCIDINSNLKCDDTEPYAVTKAGGLFLIDVNKSFDMSKYTIVAEVPKGAIDEDDGLPIEKGYTLNSLEGEPSFVSPVSSLVHTLKTEDNLTKEQAVELFRQKVSIGQEVDVLDDYIGSEVMGHQYKKQLHTVARIMTTVMAENHDPLMQASQISSLDIPDMTKHTLKTVNLHVYGQLEVINQLANDVIADPTISNSTLKASDPALKGLSMQIDLDDLYSNAEMNELDAKSFAGSIAINTSEIESGTPLVSCGVEDIGDEVSLAGIKFCIELEDKAESVRYFNVTSEIQNTIMYFKSLKGSMKYSLYKQNGTAFDEVKFPFPSSAKKEGRLYKFGSGDRIIFRLSQGRYKIVFKEDAWFSKSSVASMYIMSDASNLLYNSGVFKVRTEVTPYDLPSMNDQTIYGSLTLAQDYDYKNTIKDVIPLSISNYTSEVTMALESREVLNVKVVDSSFFSTMLYPEIILPSDGVLWEGPSYELKNQKFVFARQQDSDDAYYVVITVTKDEYLAKKEDRASYIRYHFSARSGDLAPAFIQVGSKEYQVDLSGINGSGVIPGIKILTPSGANIALNEFYNARKNAEELTSFIQTLHFVLSFDEGAMMRLYDGYMNTINAIDSTRALMEVSEELTSVAIKVFKGDVKDAVNSVASLGAGFLIKSPNDRVKDLGYQFLLHGFNVLREYQIRKKSFIKQYSLGNSIVIDQELSVDGITELEKIYFLQQRATLFIQYGMKVYKSTTVLEDRSFLEYLTDRVVAITLEFLPDSNLKEVAGKLSELESLLVSIKDVNTVVEADSMFIAMWQKLLDTSQYHSLYSQNVKDRNIAILIDQHGFQFALKSSSTGKLNDTGMTWGGNYPSGNNADCTGETIGQQDCSHGRDALAAAGQLTKVGGGDAGFDFTKLDANGNPLVNQTQDYATQPWSCVKDNHTGLIWEVKTPDAQGTNLHSMNDTFNWYNTNTATNGGASGSEGNYDMCTGYISGEVSSYCNTQALVAKVNTAGLCGATDWRLPNIVELVSIVHLGKSFPAIDGNYFPNSDSGFYWSSSPYAYFSDFAWGVYFVSGNDYDFHRNGSLRVRVVRSGQ